jgi:hypothetical protein
LETVREGKGIQQLFQDGDEVTLADFLGRTDHLELRDLVDGVDVIDAFWVPERKSAN